MQCTSQIPFHIQWKKAFLKFRSSSQWVYETSGEPLWRKKKGQKKKMKEMTVHCTFCSCKISHFLIFFLNSKNRRVCATHGHIQYRCLLFFWTVLIRQTDVQQLKLLNITVSAIKSTVPPDHFSGSKVERVVQLREDEYEYAQEWVSVCAYIQCHMAQEKTNSWAPTDTKPCVIVLNQETFMEKPGNCDKVQ